MAISIYCVTDLHSVMIADCLRFSTIKLIATIKT